MCVCVWTVECVCVCLDCRVCCKREPRQRQAWDVSVRLTGEMGSGQAGLGPGRVRARQG